MGELLPGWRQQDLLGAAGPGLLRDKNTERGINKEGERKIEEKRRGQKNCQLPCYKTSKL